MKKRFDDGGVTEGPNKNIDDDTRARAMEAVRRRMAGEDTEAAAPAPRARPKAAAPAPAPKPTPKAEAPAPSPAPTPAPKAAESKSESSGNGEDMRDRSGGNPYVAGLKKYGPGAALAAASLLPAGKLLGPVLKGIRGARAATAASELAGANASNAARMARVTAQAEKDAASNAAKRDMFKASEERLKSGAGSAAEKRLTGVENNPRRGNIPVRDVEKNTTTAPSPTKASRTKFNDDEAGITFRRGGSTGSASRRADGIATKGKTKGRMY